ncbi:MAG: KAP family NTPase [Bacteroidetes bacterium]|nr:KAP family NTPase [Bacteroidota bacterium]
MSLLKIKNNIYKFILKPIIFFGLVFLFKEPLELSANKLVNLTSIDKFDALYSKELFLLAIFIIILFLKFTRKIGDFGYLIPYYVFFIIWYLTYRLDSNGFWSFESLKLTKNIKYLDVVFLGILIILIPLRKKEQSISQNTLFEDLPIFESENDKVEDKLGYETYAKEIAEKLTKNNFQKAFAVGVNGKWGSGKTSFINLIKKELADSDFIKISFNPWASKNPEAITQDFFEELEESLIENHYLFGNLVSSYAGKILNNNSSNWVKSLLPFFTKTESFSTVHKRLEKTLSNLDKKILIVIDDIDRLDSKEIFEVLKILRNTANFKNIIYLLAYDKEYIGQKLIFENTQINNKYLEKIIQLELNLPFFEKGKLFEKLKNNILEILKKGLKIPSHERLISDIENNLIKIIPDNLPLINNLRDVTRLCNALSSNLSSEILNEINFEEFLCLELLRINEFDIYEKIKFKDKKLLLITETGISLRFNVNLIDNNNIVSKVSNDELIQTLNSYLSTKYNSEFERNIKIEEINSLLFFIFGNLNKILNQSSYPELKENLSIRRPSRFDLYFYYYLPNHKLPIFKLTKLREENNFVKFEEIIKSKIEQGFDFEIMEYFQKITGFNNKNDFKAIVSEEIKFNKRNFISEPSKTIRSASFNYELFYQKLRAGYMNFYNDDDLSIESIGEYPKINNWEKFQKFIISFITPEKYDKSCLFDSNFIFFLKGKFETEVPVHNQENFNLLQDHNLNILSGYCEKASKIDSTAIRLFRNTNKGSDSKNEIYVESAQEIMRNLIKKDLRVFLESLFLVNGRNQEFKYLDQFALGYFNLSWENFESFIISNTDKQPCFKEFLDFFEKFKSNNFNPVEGFKFKNLEIENKRLTH